MHSIYEVIYKILTIVKKKLHNFWASMYLTRWAYLQAATFIVKIEYVFLVHLKLHGVMTTAVNPCCPMGVFNGNTS